MLVWWNVTATSFLGNRSNPAEFAHAVQFFELFGGDKVDAGWDGSGISNARLCILPGVTHCNIFTSPLLASVIVAFLDKPMPNIK